MKHIATHQGTVVLGLALIFAGSVSGCATKKFVHQEVGTTANKLSARLDAHDAGIESNTNQIAELITSTKQNSQKIDQNSQKIDSVGGEAKQAEGKAVEANRAAGQAQQSADRASTRIVNLDERFANRNRFALLAEKTVFFRFNDWRLDRKQVTDLDEAARLLKENPDAVAVLEGRTDATGNSDYNLALGERRLESVVHYLVVDKDVPAYRIYKTSFGADRPVSDNGSRAGRSKNRCTVISVLMPQAGAKEIASR